MNVVRIGIAKLFSKPAGTALSVLLFAIGVTIISLLVNFEKALKDQFYSNLAGIDLVAGAKGSPLQLILSAVFHADAPTGNISLAEADRVSRNPMVEKTIPIALGDNFRGFRIVGTSHEYAELYNAELTTGNWFRKSGEVTIGWEVARRTGVGTGDEFTGVHGFMDHGHAHDYFPYRVIGVLKKSGTVIDNLILTPVQSVWDVHAGQTPGDDTHDHDHDGKECGHDHHHHDDDCDHDHGHAHSHDSEPAHEARLQEISDKIEKDEELTREEMLLYSEQRNLLAEREHDPSKEITALLILFNSPAAAVTLPRLINENTNMQAAVPAIELNRLTGLLSWGIDALRLLAWIIIIISGVNILVNLLSTLGQSAYEIAMIRVLGAPRYKVLIMLLSQGLLLALAGWLAGMLFSRLIWLIIPSVSGISFSMLPLLTSQEILLLGYTLLIGLAGAAAPAIIAYRTNIHSTLSKS
jgi:putative ABC transport system permease protein